MSLKSLLLTATYSLAASVAAAQTQPPVSERPTITVAAFEFGGVATVRYADYRGGYRRRPDAPEYSSTFAEALGTGASDLVVEKLIASQRFRVFERKLLDAVTREQRLSGDSSDAIPRARYIITGSITHLGNKDHDFGGLVGGIASVAMFRHGFGMLHTSSSSTVVKLTARVVDTRSGEIIGSFTGEGESNKRFSMDGFGAGRTGIGMINTSDRNFRETAVGEAMDRAASAIAENVIALRATALKP